MNKLRRLIAKRRRLNNVAYHASRDVLTHEFKRAVKALPINIEMLTKGKLNDTTNIKPTYATKTDECD